MPIQANGMDQSGGLNQGMRKERYQEKTRGWLGEGVEEALIAAGIHKALDAKAAAMGRDIVAPTVPSVMFANGLGGALSAPL